MAAYSRRYRRIRYRYRSSGSKNAAIGITVAAVVIAAASHPGTAAGAAHHVRAGLGTPGTAGLPSNADLARTMAATYGWTGGQFTCLHDLWQRESGFSQYADTRQTGAGGDGPGSAVFAYGIAQARPATKYPKAGQPADLGGNSDPAAQVSWGLGDIRQAYGSPCAAWAHEQADGWY